MKKQNETKQNKNLLQWYSLGSSEQVKARGLIQGPVAKRRLFLLFGTVLCIECRLLCDGVHQVKEKHSGGRVMRQPDKKWGVRVLFLCTRETGRLRQIKNGPFRVFLLVSNCEHESLDDSRRTLPLELTSDAVLLPKMARCLWKPLPNETLKVNRIHNFEKELDGCWFGQWEHVVFRCDLCFSSSGYQLPIVVTTKEFSVPSPEYKAQHLVREMNGRKTHLVKTHN